jgi:phosphinothricin acetyltransferase
MEPRTRERIRLATPGDAGAFHEIYAPIVRDTTISFETEPPPVAELARRIGETLATHPWLVMEIDGAVAGYAYAGLHRERRAYQWSVDVSCYVHERARGRGVGRALYTRLFEVLRRQGFQSAYAGIALPNDASVALHRAVGFEPVGVYREAGWKLGAWRDTSWWQRRVGDAPPDPQPPRALALFGPGILDEP